MFDVVLFTGAAGTGKTSTAQAWAASRRQVTAHLSHDDILLFTKSGLASPAEQTTAEAERQWRIALTVCSAAATIYAEHHMRLQLIHSSYQPTSNYGRNFLTSVLDLSFCIHSLK